MTHIEKAIKINPNAHFGREMYQVLLVKYMIQKRNGKAVKRMNNSSGFTAFVLNAKRGPDGKVADQDAEIKAAIKGVLGMMNFGNFNSPVLLEALGDLLLMDRDRKKDARRLATRAYLKAS